MTYIPRQKLEVDYPDYSADLVKAFEDAEDIARERLAKMGLKLLRSDKKPGMGCWPGYKIISAYRLTIAEVEKFIDEKVKLRLRDTSPQARKRAP